MNLKEEIIKVFSKKDQLFEKLFKVVDNYGHVITTLNSQEEVDEYNKKYEDDEYTIIEEPEKETKQETKKLEDNLSNETKQEILSFYQNYFNFKKSYEERMKFVQQDEPSEYLELEADKNRNLRSWWNQNKKTLSKEARDFINKKIKEKRDLKKKLKESYIGNFQYTKPLNESQQKDFTFYKTLLEATFNPNVKSSWITQIWFEPNDDFLEDEEGNPIEINPKDPNLKGTVFMRVKNSKTGKTYPTYEFYDVPRKVYIMWRRARSKGKYFWRRMKYNYEG